MPAAITHPPRKLGDETNRRRARAGQLFSLNDIISLRLIVFSLLSVRELAIHTDTRTRRPTIDSNSMISRTARPTPTRIAARTAFPLVITTHIILLVPRTRIAIAGVHA